MTTVLDKTADPRLLRGRGAVSNASGRYERYARVLLDDGWSTGQAQPSGRATIDNWDEPADEDALPPLKTQVFIDTSRSIITRNQSPDISFDRSINPYRGCEHGCIYCFARPSHAWLGLSPGADFESRLFVKPEAATLLAKELCHPGYTPATIAIGSNTDPYQPIEKRLKIMRSILEVLREFRHPVGIVTKSPLILRDLDILAPMAALGLVRVALSITTLDHQLARVLEPRAATPERRLETIRQLSQAGVPTAVMFAPIIPALNDGEMERVLAAAKEAGARSAGYVLLRLPLEIKELFREWLELHRPDAAKHVFSLIRQMRGGKDYDGEWFVRQRGKGPYASMLAHRFRLAVNRLGLHDSTRLRSDLFKRPPQPGEQLRLF
jgi:DNA repair photolyase